MSLPRRLPPTEPEPELLALFQQPDRIPRAVRRQAEFFVFFAHTIFPLLETYRERLAPLYCADNGRPAWDPVRLLAALILQFVLRVTDRQAAEAVQYDQRWRLALHMDPQDAAFDPSLLVVFRNRLVEGAQERLTFEAVLDYLVEQGWIPRRSRQRLDSTHVRGLLSAMNRLDCARETIRLLLEDVEATGVLPDAWSAYWDLYVESKVDPRAKAPALETKFKEAGADMLAIWKDAAGRWPIIERDSFVLLQRVFLEERVADKRMLRLIRKWLRVGWVEDGTRHAGTIGTPQGSVISPLLANVFPNAVMDKWASAWRRAEAKGDVIIVRYVDDAVFGFQYESDARAFLEALRERLAAHELKLHPTKTRLIEFGRFAASNRRKRGEGKPETFDFLGFTHICSVTRRGKFSLRRKTVRKRLRRKLKEVKAELIRRMHHPLKDVGAWLASVVRGFTNYHAVPGNLKAPRELYTQISRLWLWVLRRRSHKGRRRWTWERFCRLQQQWLPRPRIAHPYPNVRFDAKHSR